MLVRRLRNEVVKEMGVKNLLGKIGPLCHSSGKEDIQSVVCPASGSLESVCVSSFGSKKSGTQQVYGPTEQKFGSYAMIDR